MTNPAKKVKKLQAAYALLWRTGLTPAARTVGGWLAWHYNNDTGRCDPSAKTLSRETGLCVRSVKLALKNLEDEGVIKRRFRSGTSTSYEINWRGLTDTFEEYEKRAYAAKEVIPEEAKDRRGRKKRLLNGENNYTTEVKYLSPKPIEGNQLNEPFSKQAYCPNPASEIGAPSSSKGLDDEFADYLLGIQEDHKFLAILDRGLRKSITLCEDQALDLMGRLEKIFGEDEEFRMTGDPNGGRAHRLYERLDYYLYSLQNPSSTEGDAA